MLANAHGWDIGVGREWLKSDVVIMAVMVGISPTCWAQNTGTCRPRRTLQETASAMIHRRHPRLHPMEPKRQLLFFCLSTSHPLFLIQRPRMYVLTGRSGTSQYPFRHAWCINVNERFSFGRRGLVSVQRGSPPATSSGRLLHICGHSRRDLQADQIGVTWC